ncbi:MAG: hypothetical protein ACOC95_08135 [Planctomycetota bacterium]
MRRSRVVASVHLWRELVERAGPGRPRRWGPPPSPWWLLLGGSIAAVVALAGPVDQSAPAPAAFLPPAPAPALMTFDAVEAVTVADGPDQLFIALRSHAAFGRAVVVTVLVEPTGMVLTSGFILPPGGRVSRVFDVPASATALHVVAGGDGALSATLTRHRTTDALAVAFGRDNPFIRRLMRAMAGRAVPADPDAASFAVAVGEGLSAALPSADPGAFGEASMPNLLPSGGVNARHARPWIGAPERPAGCAVAPAEGLRLLLAEAPRPPTLDDVPRVLEAPAPPPPAATAFAWVTSGMRRSVWHSDLPRVVRPAVPSAPPAVGSEVRWEGPAILAGLFWMAGWRRLGRLL